MALYLLYGLVSITRRFKLTELLVFFNLPFPFLALKSTVKCEGKGLVNS